MKEIYQTNWELVLKFLEDSARIIKDRGGSYQPGDGGEIDQIYKAINAVHHIDKIPPSKNIPVSEHFQIGKEWADIAYNELVEFNARGYEYICSTNEAIIKSNAIKRLLDQFNKPLYFRGEHNFGWELKSRIGRNNVVDWTKNDPHKVTALELKFMDEFQDRVRNDQDLRERIFGTTNILDKDHPGWWSIMQHYDDQNGTRMIDITSSIFCGLYFACRDWDGSIDSSIDGKLYMFPYQPGRGETETPSRNAKGILDDVDDQSMKTIDTYYNIESNLEYPRFRISTIRNDRALAQDGYFVWQAMFDAPLETIQIFPFRVHRDYKESIAQELEAMGYSRDRILFENRYVV